VTIAQQVNLAMTRSSVCLSALGPDAQVQVAQAMQRVVDALQDDGAIFGPSLWSDQSQWCQDLAASDSGIDQGRYWAFCRTWEAQIQTQLINLGAVLRHFGCTGAAEVAESAADAVGAESESAEIVATPGGGAPSLTGAAWALGALALFVLVVRQ